MKRAIDASSKQVRYTVLAYDQCQECSGYHKIYSIKTYLDDTVKKTENLCLTCISKIRYGALGIKAKVLDEILRG